METERGVSDGPTTRQRKPELLDGGLAGAKGGRIIKIGTTRRLASSAQHRGEHRPAWARRGQSRKPAAAEPAASLPPAHPTVPDGSSLLHPPLGGLLGPPLAWASAVPSLFVDVGRGYKVPTADQPPVQASPIPPSPLLRLLSSPQLPLDLPAGSSEHLQTALADSSSSPAHQHHLASPDTRAASIARRRPRLTSRSSLPPPRTLSAARTQPPTRGRRPPRADDAAEPNEAGHGATDRRPPPTFRTTLQRTRL
ncbi:hypothetical protein DCS_06636 [Drechmeria coniospora]|uniref:Uncharacterized protein n=1 Tax=Drechmeria coniospora TaxID=98403 RepID=A0A151GC29_DRECN|nr:hypothetical protein DCS_06636 [Drechmeria coniospora]KYK54676.1 hypothetical protein DCS_06636 [Drechmeria coniospora]